MKLNRGSLPFRLAAFFERTPDEHLLYADILVKFGCDEKTAQAAVGKLKRMQKVRTIPAEGRNVLVAAALKSETP